MNLFIWDRVDNATENYHDEGGIVVIAETLDRARAMIAENTGKNGKPCGALTTPPDLSRECAGTEHITIHPDAGCC